VAVQIPLYLQNKLIPAKFDRQLISDLFDSIEQVVGDNDLLVTAAGGLVTATAAGRCVVQGDTNPNQGMYRCFNDASVSRTHVASGVNPKIDRLVMKVHDSVETGSGTDLADIEIVAGTPSVARTSTTQLTGQRSRHRPCRSLECSCQRVVR
jgi:hypothetical protein